MTRNLSQRAKEIVSEIRYLTIASVTPEGRPWNSPVFGGFDESYNFYFGTHKGSQKARNITANNEVFVVIYNSTVPPGSGEGVYIQGTAEPLTDINEIKRVYSFLSKRHDDHFWEVEALDGSGPINLYKITPLKIWMNDEGKEAGFYIDTRTEIELK